MQMNPMLSRIIRPQTCTSALSEDEHEDHREDDDEVGNGHREEAPLNDGACGNG
jgi:hypothetical protein